MYKMLAGAFIAILVTGLFGTCVEGVPYGVGDMRGDMRGSNALSLTFIVVILYLYIGWQHLYLVLVTDPNGATCPISRDWDKHNDLPIGQRTALYIVVAIHVVSWPITRGIACFTTR